MTKHAFFLGAVFLVAASGVAAAVGGCGSSAGGSGPLLQEGQEAGSPAPTSDPDAGGDPGTGTPPGNGLPLDDAGPIGTPGASDPGKLTCGTSQCTTATDVCCAKFAGFPPGDAGVTLACQASGDTCTGVKFGCDETPDCTNGDICCTSGGGSKCGKSCGFFDKQLCKVSSECPDAGTCSAYDCPGGLKVMACGKPFGCNAAK
jgi:hypothetical protein